MPRINVTEQKIMNVLIKEDCGQLVGDEARKL